MYVYVCVCVFECACVCVHISLSLSLSVVTKATELQETNCVVHVDISSYNLFFANNEKKTNKHRYRVHI